MRHFFPLIVFLIIGFGCSLPKSIDTDFEGSFIYRISSEVNNQDIRDSANFQVVYAKDSMLRIDNFTPIGKQIYIKHIPKNKAYILMDIGIKKVAIQTFVDTLKENNYEFKSKRGVEQIAGIECKNIEVYDSELDTTLIMNYYPKISSKYSTALEGMPGLPTKYFLYSGDIWFTYELIELKTESLNIDLFGIPSEYEKISMDEFIKLIEN